MEPSIDPLLAELLDSLASTPAVVVNERWDVLASNGIARAISPSLRVGVNLAEATFVGLSARRTLPAWGEVAARMAALLREAFEAPSTSPHGDNAASVADLRDRLSRRSSEFAVAWGEGETPGDYALEVTMDHPEVGRLEITYEVLRVPGAAQTLVIGHAVPGSPTELRLLDLAERMGPWHGL